ncbi:hypothetical protein [Spirosoma sp. KUDC1026]|uniref:hypothetical protein n=1 Tax=Spirosoma sp. KUDC1026 TaxID=2745947 RepID=UPI00159BA664|nr:hypothetical protein [Spirosoma sp. KUDC1026]QKZ15276.1 hypothetical protein HU175_22690 [Spirosoma sp. KUDC1026]
MINHSAMKSLAILTTFCALCLTSCVTAYFQSNVKPEAKPDFKRILVVTYLPLSRPEYMNELKAAFPTGYQVCAVSVTPLSFDDPKETIQKQQQTCQSDVMLTLDFDRSFTTGSGKSIDSHSQFYAEMIDLSTNKPFWKAIITTTTSSQEVSARELVKKLQEDDIIKGKIPTIPYQRYEQDNY